MCEDFKVTQELIQSDPHSAPNTKGKERQIQISCHKMKRWQQSWQLFPKKVAKLLPKLN